MVAALPSHARAVVVGGGIVGCSVAYHLAARGWSEVLLLERGQLTCGSTFHAAGLVGQLRSSASITRLLGRSVELYESLEEETGQATGWKKNGGLRLACTPERMIELKRQATTARSFGLEMHMLTPSEARDMWPLIEVHDVLGAAFLPTDGAASPSDVTQALAKGARQRGVRIVQDCPVRAIETHDGRVRAVVTDLGRVEADVVVNCAGQWARELGALAGVNVPLISVQHQFMITEPIDGVRGDLPTLRDPDRLTYYKEEVGGLVMGGYEPNPIAWAERGIPDGFTFQLLPPDWDHFSQLSELALARLPCLETAGIRKLINGPESFTPDGSFILGEAPELKGFFVAAGFNAYGIAAAGGAGWALAEWIEGGEPPFDLWPVDIRRFGPHHSDVGWVRSRTLELYGKHYTLSWPHEEHTSGRPLRRSPLYDRLSASGACFGEKLGWERPNWFAPQGVEPVDDVSFGRAAWFEHIGREHRAVRATAGLFDQTSFAKLVVEGPDAEAALDFVCAGDLRKPPGALTYTQLCNRRGGIECDLTVARVDEERFYLVTGTAFGAHDRHWIEAAIPDGLRATVHDVTTARAVLSLMGPRARDILSAVCDDDVSDAAFPFGQARQLSLGGVSTLALRVTYVGELGWELHLPVEQALTVFDQVWAAGAPLGLVHAGYRAIESLRLEKGYRAWGADVTPGHTPVEAGLRWATKLDTDRPFLGRDALERQVAEGVRRRFATFTTEPDVVLLGRETIFRDGERVGFLTSGGFGHTVERSIGFGYVAAAEPIDLAWVRNGTYELEVARERVPAVATTKALFDPRHERVRG